MPIGTVKAPVKPIVQIVPKIADFIPAISGCLEGKLVKKCQLNQSIPSNRILTNKINSPTIPIKTHDSKRKYIICPNLLRLVRFVSNFEY